jgi:probable phosphoglycerate mutase
MMVVFIRHAERQSTGTDPGLTPAGKRRAQLLVTMLADAAVSAIFTSSFRRTKETAAPLATKLGIAARPIDEDTTRARAQILAAGACVLVVGHSDTVPELIGALGGPPDLEIGDDEFDRMFVLSAAPTGPPSVLAMRYVSA